MYWLRSGWDTQAGGTGERCLGFRWGLRPCVIHEELPRGRILRNSEDV